MSPAKTHPDQQQTNSSRSNAGQLNKGLLKLPSVPALLKQADDHLTQSPSPKEAAKLPGTLQKYSKAVAPSLTSIKEEHGNMPAVQRYAAANFIIDGGNISGTLSETGKYFLPDGSGNLYATAPPRFCQDIGGKDYAFNGKTYRYYAPAMQFLDDCLHTAEEIVNGRILAYAKATYTRESTSNYVFGQSDKRNIEIAEYAKANSAGSVDASAAPGVGNAFVIVDTEFETRPSKRSPYHAAGVIGVDGSDCVTMEVFAHGGSLVNRLTNSSLGIYTVGGGSTSFHGYWSTGYFKNYNTITIVIKAK